MGVERLYNSVEFDEPVELKIGRSWRRGVVGKPHQAEGAWGPDELGSREDADKMQ